MNEGKGDMEWGGGGGEVCHGKLLLINYCAEKNSTRMNERRRGGGGMGWGGGGWSGRAN